MFGGMNPMKLMQQMQKVQDDMAQMQDDLDAERLQSSSGGGMVKVTTTGLGEVISIEISPEVVDPSDIETLQDLVTAAVREAVKSAQEHHQGRMAQITSGLPNIPGLNLPGM